MNILKLFIIFFVILLNNFCEKSKKEIITTNYDSTKNVKKEIIEIHGLFVQKTYRDINNLILQKEYKSNDSIYRICYKENRDTLSFSNNNKNINFLDDQNKIENINLTDDKGQFVGQIFFDNNGRIEYFLQKEIFLTKSDTLRLNKDYPDWMEQVKEWEIKNGKK